MSDETTETGETGEDTPSVDPWAAEQLSYMRQKLEAAGATPGELEEFSAQWLDPGWDHEEKVKLLSLGDAKLRDAMLESRAEGLHDTTTEDEEADAEAAAEEAARLADIKAEADEMSAQDPTEIVDWAGDDRERLQAALDVELAHPEPRDELVDVLRSALG